MLSSLKGAAKRVPVIGPALQKAYLSLVVGEGRVRRIKNGPLTGAKYYHYRWSTPSADLVETNWNDHMPAVLAKEIKGKKCFFDIGANWGFYVLLANRHRDAGCQIVAFEPHPQSAKELGTQITLNHVEQAIVIQAAVSNQIGTLDFVDTGSAIGQQLAAVSDRQQARTITVPTTTLDAASANYGPPDIIKLDVEGAENMVLTGGSETFTKHRPILLVEVHGEERSGPFYDLMDSYNYRCVTMDGQTVTDRTYHHHLVCYPN